AQTMVQVWYMEESQDDLRWPPGLEPSCPVLLEQLHQLGVLYWKLTRVYHCFTLDEKNYVTAVWMFVGETVWTAYNQSADHFHSQGQD
ncbi:hypothetical protein E2I00_010213, partial [Balaenoptera physalus]